MITSNLLIDLFVQGNLEHEKSFKYSGVIAKDNFQSLLICGEFEGTWDVDYFAYDEPIKYNGERLPADVVCKGSEEDESYYLFFYKIN